MTKNIIDTFIDIENAAHAGAFGDNPRAIPTDAQAIAGNYKLGRTTIHGLPVAIEQPRHSFRAGVDQKTGKRWTNRMAAHYGYFSGTKGADGDGVDCFIGFYPQSEHIYIINQFVDGRFDEHKVMICFPDEQTAKRAYLDSYDKGWNGLHSIIKASVTQFKWWLKNGNMKNAIALNHLPYEGLETMKQQVAWDSSANPIGTALHNVLYEIKRADSGENLIFDAVCMQDILEMAESIMAFDALVTPYAKLERKMKVLQNVMDRSAGTIKTSALQISDPFKQSGVAQVAALFELSDGQTVTIFFHNPDVDPRKIQQDDELITWKWLLNKKDITIVVAPEKGQDLNVRTVAERIMKLAEKNGPAFIRANGKRTEKMQDIEDIKVEITSLEVELKAVQHELEVAKVEAEDRALTSSGVEMSELEQKISARFNGATVSNVVIDNELGNVTATINGVKNVDAGFAEDLGIDWEKQELSSQPAPEITPEPVIDHETIEPAVIDPTGPEGYAKIMADPVLQGQYQDALDTFFKERVIATLNALHELDWSGGQIAKDLWMPIGLAKNGTVRTFIYQYAPGANKNVIGYSVSGVTDDLTKTPEQFAAEIDAAAVEQKIIPEPELTQQDQNEQENQQAEITTLAEEGGAEADLEDPEDFVSAPDGSKDFGEITQDVAKDIKRQPGKIKLQIGEHLGKNKGYGLVHIREGHPEIKDPVAFVKEVVSNFSEIWKTKNGRLILIKRGVDKTGEVSIVQLLPDSEEDFYSVVTSYKSRNPEGEILLWDATHSHPTDSGIQPALQSDHHEASDEGKSAEQKEDDKIIDQSDENSISANTESIQSITPAESVNSAYHFNATDDFKEWLAESVDKTEQSPFLTAKAMDEAAKRNGADIEWGFFGGAALDSVGGDNETDIALVDEDELGATFVPDSVDEAVFDSAVLDGVEQDGYVGKITKGGAVVGRIDIGDDGKALVFVGESGDTRVKFASGVESRYSDDDAAEMVDSLFNVSQSDVSNEDLAETAIDPAPKAEEETLPEITPAAEELAPVATGNTELDKQRAKLRSLADLQERMKSANKVVNNKKLSNDQKVEQLIAQGFDEHQVREILKPDYMGRIGFAGYQLTNNNAVIKNTQKRIAQLEAQALAESQAASGDRETSYDFDGGTIDLDYGDDRLRVNFDSKPASDMISKLKQNGFKWSPTNTAWQRQLTDNTISTANYLFGTKIQTAASAMNEEVNKPRGEVIVPANQPVIEPQENPIKTAFEVELNALKLETDIERFDIWLDEIVDRIELAGMMEEMDVQLNEAADILTGLMAEAENKAA